MQDLNTKKKKSKEPIDLSGITGKSIGNALDQLPKKTKENVISYIYRNTGMFGTTIFNNLKIPLRPSLQIHPYSWSALGSTIVPVCRDKDGQLHVAIVYNLRKDPQIKKYRLSEGYMHPKPCPAQEGSKNNGLAHNDEAEEQISFKGVDSFTAYSNYPPQQALKPDTNLEETAIREAREEIGVELSKNQLTEVYSFDAASAIHTISKVYLADLTKKYADLPELKTQDPAEIGEIRWVQFSKIQKVITDLPELKFKIDTIEIPQKYAVCLGFALKEYRKQEINTLGIKFISTPQNLFAVVESLYEGDLKQLISTPSNELFSKNVSIDLISGIDELQKKERALALAELGPEAEIYHQKLMRLGKAIAEKIETAEGKLFNVKAFTHIEIEQLITPQIQSFVPRAMKI